MKGDYFRYLAEVATGEDKEGEWNGPLFVSCLSSYIANSLSIHLLCNHVSKSERAMGLLYPGFMSKMQDTSNACKRCLSLLKTHAAMLCDRSLRFYGNSLSHICLRMNLCWLMVLKILFRMRRPGTLQVLFVARVLTPSQSLTYNCQPKCRLELLSGCHGNRSSTRVLAATGCWEAFFLCFFGGCDNPNCPDYVFFSSFSL